MSKSDGVDLYREKRSAPRVSLRSTIRFNADSARPLNLARGITQDFGIGGVRILSRNVLDDRRTFDVWVTVPGYEVVRGHARVAWMHIEDILADSPYWLRAGLSVSFPRPSDRKAIAEYVSSKTNIDREVREEMQSKIAYIF